MTGYANRQVNRANGPTRFFIISTNGPLETGFSSLRTLTDIFLIFFFQPLLRLVLSASQFCVDKLPMIGAGQLSGLCCLSNMRRARQERKSQLWGVIFPTRFKIERLDGATIHLSITIQRLPKSMFVHHSSRALLQ